MKTTNRIKMKNAALDTTVYKQTKTKNAKKTPKKPAKSFEEECRDFTIEHLIKAKDALEAIGGAADDAGMEYVSGEIQRKIEELEDLINEANGY